MSKMILLLHMTSIINYGYNMNLWIILRLEWVNIKQLHFITAMRFFVHIIMAKTKVGELSLIHHSCVLFWSNFSIRIVAISFMIDKEEHFAKKYHPFAWFSSINDIKWKPLDIQSKAFDIPGTWIPCFNQVTLNQILLQFVIDVYFRYACQLERNAVCHSLS